VEYRFPISYLLRGFSTAPVFLDRLHGALFMDAGETWDTRTSFRGSNILYSAGAEIRFDVTLGYWLNVTPAIGYAHGFDKKFGIDQVYFMMYTNL
jgi:outer membrane protein assembly factor BamA